MEEGEEQDQSLVTDLDQERKKKVPKAPTLPIGASVDPQSQGADLPHSQEGEHDPESTIAESTTDIVADELPAEPKLQKKNSNVITSNASEEQQLKAEWALKFLKNNGFAYILKVFMHKATSSLTETDSSSDFASSFELKHLAFILKLLRIFTMAAFSQAASTDEGMDEAILLRRSSSIRENEKEG